MGEIAPPPPTPAEISPLDAMRWFALVLFMLSGTSLWLYARRQPEREAKKRLRAACRRGHAQQAHKALIEWRNSATAGEAAPLLAQVGNAWDARAREARRTTQGRGLRSRRTPARRQKH